MTGEAKSGNSIRALERGFEIVEVLRKQESLTLTEVSETLDIPTSTAHVYLKTLEQEGFVTREEQKYHAGLRFLEYGGHIRQRLDIYNASAQVLQELALRTGERIGLGVEENGQRVLIGIEDGHNAVSDNIPLGEFTEMHWTGLGKCLLAHLPKRRREEIIITSDLPRATENTITDPAALREEIAIIRKQGYAIENEERREGVRGVDVPILSPDEELLGAIGVSAPVSRLDVAQLSEYVDLLENKANVIKLKAMYY
jgi:DNA-binding IclR family transcriptional regulator